MDSPLILDQDVVPTACVAEARSRILWCLLGFPLLTQHIQRAAPTLYAHRLHLPRRPSKSMDYPGFVWISMD